MSKMGIYFRQTRQIAAYFRKMFHIVFLIQGHYKEVLRFFLC